MSPSLLVLDETGVRTVGELACRVGKGPVVVLAPLTITEATDFPATWSHVPPETVFDLEAFRSQLFEFLNRWPERRHDESRTFDDLFRRRGGYSVWWTGVASERSWKQGSLVAVAKRAWILDRLMTQVSPSKVVAFTRSSLVASAYASRCESSGIPIEFLEGSAQPVRDPWRGTAAWLVSSARRMIVFTLRLPLLAFLARLYASTPGHAGAGAGSRGPAVVFTWRNADYWRPDGREVRAVFWHALCHAIRTAVPKVSCRFLVRGWSGVADGWRMGRLVHTGWSRLRHLEGAVPIPQRYPALGAWLGALPAQCRDLYRYARIERTGPFRESLRFAGSDLSSACVDALRDAIATSAQWAQSVAAVKASIRSVGDVRALIVAEELYPSAMADIAAARELGIPSIGIQHGTIHPMHLVYTLPAGQVRGAPSPDRLAVYGTYAKEIVCNRGAFPEDRVWVAGAPRLDHLVRQPQKRNDARQALGLPIEAQIVLVTTQTYRWFPDVVHATILSLKDRPNCIVCVKIHPKRVAVSADAYEDMAREQHARNVRVFEQHFDTLLTACDVLVSASSTTVLEAILLDRLTISVNFSDQPDWYPYAAEGGSLSATNERELLAALSLALDRPTEASARLDREKFLERHAGPTASGSGADTLAQLVIGAIRQTGDAACSAAGARSGVSRYHGERSQSGRGLGG